VTSTSKHQQQTNYHRHHGGATATAGAKRMLTTSGNNKNDDDPTTPPKKNEGLILPERGVAELLGSSIQGLFSFLDADSRDKFIERANSNIINPSALGIPVSLALHHELECVLWDKYKFDVMEFGNGVGHALEYYHDMDAKFHEEINQQVSKVTKMDMSAFQTQPPPEKQEADKDENNDNIDNYKKIDNIDNNNDSNIKLSFPKPMTEKPLKFLEVVTQLAKDLKTFADDHPESAAAKIQSLTTPFLFEMQCFASAQGHLLFKMGAMDKAMPEVWKHKVVIENVSIMRYHITDYMSPTAVDSSSFFLSLFFLAYCRDLPFIVFAPLADLTHSLNYLLLSHHALLPNQTILLYCTASYNTHSTLFLNIFKKNAYYGTTGTDSVCR
jgi:hypothetical protein